MYYAVFLFQQAGLQATSASLLANGLQGVVLNVFTWPNMYYMDKWGRRIPMIIGAAGMGIAMMLIGVLMKTQGTSPRPKCQVSEFYMLIDVIDFF
jgi:MFS family permease